ncbi:RNA polymerase sigma factor [Pseudofulvibacter geojedonensis]|uniref:RNA polymerase sigma factor n=1 Tax=Pseudofulvibacter geojedonensis TaxID=1123758 RepID=A0ABW3I4F3_9FLAO
MSDTNQPDNNICQERNFQQFFNKNATLLRNYLYYKFGDLNEVDDLVQDAFIKVWDNCSKVTKDSAKSYLFRIAINMSTSVLRHKTVKLKHQKEVISIQKDQTNESPEYLLQQKEFQEKLEKAIASLPDRQREVYLLNRIEQKTYKEIAELSGVSVKAIEKLISKALVKLRKEIENIR